MIKRLIPLLLTLIFLIENTGTSYALRPIATTNSLEEQTAARQTLKSDLSKEDELIRKALASLVELGRDSQELKELQLKHLTWDDLKWLPPARFIDLTNNIFAREDLWTDVSIHGIYGWYKEFIGNMPPERGSLLQDIGREVLAHELLSLFHAAQNLGFTLSAKDGPKETADIVQAFTEAYAFYYFNKPDRDIARGSGGINSIENQDKDTLDTGTGISGIAHIKDWKGTHRLILLDKNLFIVEMLKRYLKLTGKGNIEVVQADILDYEPEGPIACLRISSSLRHLFRAGEGTLEQKRARARDLFFNRAFSILGDGGVLSVFDKTDEFKDLSEKDFQSDPIEYVAKKYGVDVKGLQAQRNLYKDHFKVIALLGNSVEKAGFVVNIEDVGQGKDRLRQRFLHFKLSAEKPKASSAGANLNSEDREKLRSIESIVSKGIYRIAIRKKWYNGSKEMLDKMNLDKLKAALVKIASDKLMKEVFTPKYMRKLFEENLQYGLYLLDFFTTSVVLHK